VVPTTLTVTEEGPTDAVDAVEASSDTQSGDADPAAAGSSTTSAGELEANPGLGELAKSQLAGSGIGSATMVSQTGAELLMDGLLLSVTNSDFVIEASTVSCTEVAWTLKGAEIEREYNSENECFGDHVMSPRTDVTLRPDSKYDVVVTFLAGSQTQVLVFQVETASGT
jgi:hypothetical protein